MSYSIEALAHAARRAKDVAALIDAARVLTFLAKARARERALGRRRAGTGDIESIYHTASELALVGRELVAEAEMLLVDAQGASTPPGVDDEVCAARGQLANSMRDALGAIEMLESVQELGAEELHAPPLGTPASRGPQRIVDELMARLQR